MKATIYFSDKSLIEVNEDDYLIPVIRVERDNECHASIGSAIKLWNHLQNGLITSIMDVFIKCDYFYLNHNYDVIYNSKAIVKIELS